MKRNDYSGIFGGSILSFVEETVGPILNADRPRAISMKTKVRVDAYVASVRDDPGSKVLFTLGLFGQKKPDDSFLMKECFICLPSGWPLPRYNFKGRTLDYGLTTAPHFPETLAYDILSAVTRSVQRKGSKFVLEEGAFLDKGKGEYAKLSWPQDMAGAAVVDYQWPSEDDQSEEGGGEDGGSVTLLTVAPVYGGEKPSGPAWFEERRHCEWRDLRFPLFADMALVEEMNAALVAADWGRVSELLDSGIGVNRGVYQEHPIWGDLVSYTYLEHAALSGRLDVVKKMVGMGAKVPSDALAIIAGIRGTEMFEYFLSLGCDVNAVDNVGYTALNRAVSFGNRPVIELCKSLGGIYRAQRFDKEEKLAALREEGIVVEAYVRK